MYTYDDLNQLTKLEQGQYTYDYKDDAEKERISQIWTDTKDYHYDQWYNYSEPVDVVGDKEIEDTFKNLKEQAKKKKDNGNVCTSVLSDKYDVTYFIEPEVTEYTLDRNQEYTQILKSNDTINVYGATLLQSDNESIITAKNESVVAKVTSQDIKKISYSDYGQTNDIKSGNGYNSETLDQTGLIYLRARYYDPSVSRFVQIDNNYDGEKQSVASQNKYVYTMNNPYKYVDRNGNWSLWGSICDVVDDVVKSAKKAAKKAAKAVMSWFKPIVNTITQVVNKVAKAVTNVFDGGGSNSNSGKSGGSKVSKPPVKKVKVEAKCPSLPTPKLEVVSSRTEPLSKKVYNFGICSIEMTKELKTTVILNKANKKAFTTIGIGNQGFNIGFSLDLSRIASIASGFGFSVGFGDWGAIKLGISSTLGNATLGLNARVETLKFWVNSSLSASLTSKLYDEKGVKISVVDTFTLKINALAVAVCAFVLVKVLVPAMPGIISALANLSGKLPAILEGIKNAGKGLLNGSGDLGLGFGV